MALSIQSLKSEALIAAQRVINQQSNQFPLEGRFSRRQYDGEELEIRVRRAVVKVGKYTGADGPAYLTKPGELQRIYVTPLYTRPMHRFSNADLNLFRMWDQVLQSGGGEQGTDVSIMAGDRLADIVEEVSYEGREAMHDMLVGALLGTFDYEIDGATVSVDYGHSNVGSGILTTAWTNAAAKIIENIWEMLHAYTQASGGVRADTCYYSSEAWSKYWIKNTQFQEYVKANDEMAKGFSGAREGFEMVDGMQRFIDPMFRLEWVPVDGPHTLQDGTVEDRWPVDKFVLTSERQDTKRLLEHSMVKDDYNPSNTWNWESFRNPEPKGLFARYADNGAASILIPERVQYFDAEP